MNLIGREPLEESEPKHTNISYSRAKNWLGCQGHEFKGQGYLNVFLYQYGISIDGLPVHLLLFTALHGMQTRSSDENSVCLSVRQTRAL